MSIENRVVIIGCGKGGEGIGAHSIGYRHANAYRQLNFPIVGACDLNPENLERFASEYDVPNSGTDLASVLSNSKPEIASICTYVGSHLSILETCIQSGVRGVFMEKPVCLSSAEGRAMLTMAEANDVKVVVNHYRRYLPRFRDVRDALSSGVVGEPILYFAGIDGWDLMEWGTHWLDMFRFLAHDQEVSWVMGQAQVTDRSGYGHVMEDHAVACFEFADGSKALLDGGRNFKGDIAMRIVGTDGVMQIPDFAPVFYTNSSGRHEFSEGTNIHSDDADLAWQLLLQDLQSWRSGGAEPQCSLANALKSSELYLAAYESAISGGEICLPLSDLQDSFPLSRRNNGTKRISQHG